MHRSHLRHRPSLVVINTKSYRIKKQSSAALKQLKSEEDERRKSLVSVGVSEGDLVVVSEADVMMVIEIGSHAVVGGCLEVHVVPVWVISKLLLLVPFVLEPILYLSRACSLNMIITHSA